LRAISFCKRIRQVTSALQQKSSGDWVGVVDGFEFRQPALSGVLAAGHHPHLQPVREGLARCGEKRDVFLCGRLVAGAHHHITTSQRAGIALQGLLHRQADGVDAGNGADTQCQAGEEYPKATKAGPQLASGPGEG
jgi:hypothetical protein